MGLFPSTLRAAGKVAAYANSFTPYYAKDKKIRIAIRRFTYGAKEKLLVVDPYTFDTFITDAASIDTSQEVKRDALSRTPFVRALERYTAPDGKLHNSGIVKGEDETGGLFLTVDLCPSRKEFDKELFTSTMELDPKTPAPVALAISGLWIERHRDDFDWIVKEEKAGRLAVTWVNHTYSHPYNPRKRNIENFLLTPGTDFEKEALREEAVLIEHGEVPSPFFRFPGLVSSDELLLKLKGLSLIPIGANAWIAKGEVPKKGSIILVHGNGNEPEGIKRLLEFFDKNRDGFKKGDLRLLPLKDAFQK